MGGDDNQPMDSSTNAAGGHTRPSEPASGPGRAAGPVAVGGGVPLTEHAGRVRLPDWGVIAARGPDAADFLHGQLTQDLKTLGQDRARLAGYCSPKGRLLATFIVVRGREDELLLLCSADVLAATLKRLSMFVLRARCKLADATAEFALRGEWSAGSAEPGTGSWPAEAWGVTREEDSLRVRLPDAAGVARALRIQAGGASPGPLAASTAPPPLEADSKGLAEYWQWLEVCSGVPRIVARTADQFVPQMVNLQAVGGVNFQKGCYPGQEVVARSQYRGTLKRRGFLLESGMALQPGDEVYAADDPGQPAGLVALAAAVPGRPGAWQAFAEVKIAAAEADALHLGAADGPRLRLLPLPYPVAIEP